MRKHRRRRRKKRKMAPSNGDTVLCVTALLCLLLICGLERAECLHTYSREELLSCRDIYDYLRMETVQSGYAVKAGYTVEPGYPGGQLGPSVVSQQPMGYPLPPQVMSPHPTNQTMTTVVVNQPPVVTKDRTWNTGLFGCFDDCSICMLVWCCPMCAAYKLLEDMGESTCLPCCVFNWEVAVRARLRALLGIKGSICDDCCATTFCGTCAMCQLLREIKHAKAQGQF